MTSESQVAAIFFTFLVATFIINNKTHKKQLGMQVTHAAEPIAEQEYECGCVYISLLEKAMAQRKKRQISNERRMRLLQDYSGCRNMLTPCGMPTLDNIKDLAIEALFDCASRRTQGSLADTVH